MEILANTCKKNEEILDSRENVITFALGDVAVNKDHPSI